MFSVHNVISLSRYEQVCLMKSVMKSIISPNSELLTSLSGENNLKKKKKNQIA